MASNITEMAFDDLDAPPVVVGSRNWITPAYEMEEHFFPQPWWILDAIHERIIPLNGHRVRTDWSHATQLQRSREGV
jgi:2-oxoisovalerate dehydrogenase E1 component